MNIDNQKLSACHQKATEQAKSSGILNDFQVEHYIRCMDGNDRYARYNQPAHSVLDMCDRIRSRGGDAVLEAFHRLVLIRLIELYPQRIANRSITPEIEGYYEQIFERVLTEMSTNAPGFYLYPNDYFMKDLGLCSLRLIPAGMRMVEEISGVPRSILFDDGIGQFLRGCLFFAFRVRGFCPVYESHTDIRNLDGYNADGYEKYLHRIAGLMKINPHIKGLFTGGWFYDPKAIEISPRIGYLRQLPVKNGAQAFYAGPHAGARANALARSKTRRRLYEEGKYEPVNYRLVWARSDLLRWADEQDGS